MGLRYYHPDLNGFITNVHRRKVHVRTTVGGVDKIIFIYLFECDFKECTYTETAAGLPAIHKAADRHYYAEHVKVKISWMPDKPAKADEGEADTPPPGVVPF